MINVAIFNDNGKEKEYRQSFENRMEKGQIAKDQPEEIIACEVIWHKLNQMRGAALSTLEATDRRLEIHNRYRLDTRSIQSYNNHFELLVKDLKRWKKEKYRVALMPLQKVEVGMPVDILDTWRFRDRDL